MRTTFAKLLLALALVSSAGTLLGACHTIQGAGEDISSVGAAGERAVGH